MSWASAIFRDALGAHHDVLGRGLSVTLRAADGSTLDTPPQSVKLIEGEELDDEHRRGGRRRVDVAFKHPDVVSNPNRWVGATFAGADWYIVRPPKYTHDTFIIYTFEYVSSREEHGRGYRRD